MVDVSKNRARLFEQEGALVADSMRLNDPGGQVEIELLPPTQPKSLFAQMMTNIYDWIIGLLPTGRHWPLYHEPVQQHAGDYPEVSKALAGEVGMAVYER